MKHSWKLWLHGLASAAIGGAAAAIVGLRIEPNTFNFQNGLTNLLQLAAASAILTTAAYLVKSPLPPR